MKITAAIFFCFLLIDAVCIPVSGLAEVRGIKKIYIAEEGLWPPYTFETDGTPTTGIAWEVMNAIFGRLGIEIDMRLLPQERMLHYLKDGKKDVVSVISKNRDRLTFLDYSDPLLQDEGVFCYSPDRMQAFQWEEFKDLVPYRIGIVRGHNCGNEFRDAIVKYNLNIQYVTNYEQNYKKLMAGRVDIILINRSSTSEYLRNHPEAGPHIRIADKPYFYYDYHVAFSKKSPAKVLIPDVNKVIATLKAEGVIDDILKKYNMK